MSKLVLNYGSINIDQVYRVPHFVQPGETLSSSSLVSGLGGKGANQSVALSKAGAQVKHIGRVSSSDGWATELMASLGVNVENIEAVEQASGHAIIQVDDQGENAILLHGGANRNFEFNKLKDVLTKHRDAEFLLMQNECNLAAEAFALAHQLKLKVAFNPAPMTSAVKDLPLSHVDTLIVNQIEAQALTNKTKLNDIIIELKAMLPNTRIAITLGAKGAALISHDEVTEIPAPTVKATDTTAAGDTFVGYFLAGITAGLSDTLALQQACKAAAITVTRAGAISSIPSLADLTSPL